MDSRSENPVSFYRANGFYIAKQLLPRDEVTKSLREIHRVVSQQLNRLGLKTREFETIDELHQDFATLKNADLKSYLASLRLGANLYSVLGLVMHSKVREMSAALGIELPVFQTTPVFHVMSHDLRIEDGYFGVGVHQDWPALQGGLDTVTTWIPMVDVPATRFPLEVIPGSHLKGFLPSTQQQHIHEVESHCYDASKFVGLAAEVGDVIFMSSFTIHRTGLTGDSGLRISISARYENAAEPNFIERGYPHTQKRVVERTLITKDFPSQNQVLKALGID